MRKHLNRISEFLNLYQNILFLILIFFISIYIGSIKYPGIYYDYYQIPGYSAIAEVNSGRIPIEEMASYASENPEPLLSFIGVGRYHPLYLTDFRILARVLGVSTWEDKFRVFWIYQGLLFFVFIFCLYSTVARITQSDIAGRLAALALFLHAGFWYVWTTLGATSDTQAAAFFTIGLFFYLRFLDSERFIDGLLCVAFSFISFHFKEPIAAAAGLAKKRKR